MDYCKISERLGLEGLPVFLCSCNIDEEHDGVVRGVADLRVNASPWNVYSRYVVGVRLRRVRNGPRILFEKYSLIICRNMRGADFVGVPPWREILVDDVAGYRPF